MDLIPFGWDPFEGTNFPSAQFSASRGNFPKVDVQETNKDVVLIADIPGFDPKKVNVEITADSVKLSGSISHEKEIKDKQFYRKERSSQSFSRVVPLPCPVKENEAKAVSKNGILTITIPKQHTDKPKGKKIPIEEA